MSSKDLANRLTIVQSLAPASRTAAVNGTGVDLSGYESAVVQIGLGAIGGTTPSFEFEVQDSADNVTYAAVPAADLIGLEPVVTTSENADKEIGYIGAKKFIRVAITVVSGTTPTLLCSASVIRSDARHLKK